MTWVECDCGKKFQMQSGESRSCPSCGSVAHLAHSGSNWVKCGNCLHKFEIRSGQTKTCPKCGHVASR